MVGELMKNDLYRLMGTSGQDKPCDEILSGAKGRDRERVPLRMLLLH